MVKVQDSHTGAPGDCRISPSKEAADYLQNARSNGGGDSLPSRYDLMIRKSLRRIIHAVDICSRKLKADFQITGPQLVCLACVVRQAPITLTSISKNVHLSPSTLVGILDRLEARGWIRRERSSRDRRRIAIVPTEEGRKLVKTAPSPLHGKLSRGLRRLSNDEQAQIADSLEKIVELMEAPNVSASPMLLTTSNPGEEENRNHSPEE